MSITNHPTAKTAETIDDALRRATAALMGCSGSPRLDAQLILAHVLEKTREYLIAHGRDPLTDMQAHIFDKLLTLRRRGMPLPYILGRRAFFERSFLVTSHVLIPRPETEHIVEATLEWAASPQAAGRGRLRIVDVGTGSGNIAVSVAARLPDAQIVAADVSAAALLIARQNGADLSNIDYVQSDLLAALRGPFDVICANLPYIATGDIDLLEVAKFEPHVALDGGRDGLNLIRRLLDQSPTRLRRPGMILLEMATDQGEAVLAQARDLFPGAALDIVKDYAHLERVARIRW